MKKWLVVLALAMVISACNKPKVDVSEPPPANPPAAEPTTTSPPVDDARDYQVYSAVINEQFKGSSLVVIDRLTTPVNGLGVSEDADDSNQEKEYLFKNLKLLTPELYADFRQRNDRTYLLQRKFNIAVEYKLVSEADMKIISSESGPDGWWKEYYRRYPGATGTITLSRVGYSADGKTAMVYVGYWCGPLCGSGDDLILVLENGEWKIKEKVMLWIS